MTRLSPETLPSPEQLRCWFTGRLSPGTPYDHLTALLRLAGPLRIDRLREALAQTVERHAALRTRITETPDGEPVAEAGTADRPVLLVTDLSALPPEARAERVTALAAELAERPFDLSTGPLLRAHLFRLAADRHTLCVCAHRVAADEAALGRLLSDLGTAYAAHTAGASPPPPRPHRAPSRESEPEPRERARRLEFWTEELRAAEPLELPVDRPRPTRPSGRAGAVSRRLTRSVSRGLARLTGADGGPGDPAAAILAGLLVVLARYGGRPDLTVGVPAEPRPEQVTAGAGPVPLRVRLDDAPSFTELVARCRIGWDRAASNAVPLAALLPRGARDWSRHPLFQVAITVLDVGESWPADLETAVSAGPVPATPYDLCLQIVSGGGAVELNLVYARDLIDESRAERMLDHLEVLLAAAAADPGQSVTRLPLLRDPERDHLLHAWQGPVVQAGPELIHQQFRRRARGRPDDLAARMNGRDLTYGELDRRSDLLATRLRMLGIRHEEIVGVALERGLDAFVAFLGVLKAGAAFVVLDPAHPLKRLEYVLSDTGTRVVLTDSAVLPRLPEPAGWSPLCLDGDWEEEAAAGPAGPPTEWADHDSLAYVLYTSGSTGRPKGVMIDHGALLHYPLWLSRVFDLGPGDRMLQHMALSFDFSEGEMFAALTSGAAMVIIPEAERASPQAMAELMRAEGVTYLGGPPPLLARLPANDLPELRYFLTGGDLLHGDLVNRWLAPGRRFVNAYGPTEAAIGCVWYECEAKEWTTPPPIGRPMPNRYMYVVDRWDNLCPAGVPGEILIGGEGVGRGYLNNPELTAARFTRDPFRPHGRVYRTGDLGVWSADGQLHFVGRIDTQVKLNGTRIEVEEIESVLVTHPAVTEAVVTLRQDGGQAARLVAYLTVEGAAPGREELRAHLSEELPAYMLPAQFVVLETMPLTTAGKVDRKALPAPFEAGPRPVAALPRTPVERQVASVVAEVLGGHRVDVEADFFELGGDSLAALRVVARVNRAFGCELPVAAFCTEPTVRAVAAHVERRRAERGPPAGGGAAGSADPEEDAARRLLAEIEALSDEEAVAALRGGTGARDAEVRDAEVRDAEVRDAEVRDAAVRDAEGVEGVA